MRVYPLALVLVLVMLPALAWRNRTHAAEAGQLAAAVRELRGNSRHDFTPEVNTSPEGEPHSKVKAIMAAWDALQASPEEAVPLLVREGDQVIADGEEDYAFLLGASALLFEMTALEEAPAIDRFWGYSRDNLDTNPNYVMGTAIRAAHLGDARALLFLRHLLHDRKVNFFLPSQSLTLRWPLTVMFTWEAMGSTAAAAVPAILKGNPDDVATLISSINLAVAFQSLESLPPIRRLTSHADPDLRHTAIWAIGRFGHPDDFDLLAAGLRNLDDKRGFASWASAAHDYRDDRTVDIMLDQMQRADGQQLEYICAALLLQPTAAGVAAVTRTVEEPDPRLAANPASLERLRRMVDNFASAVTTLSGRESLAAFLALPAEEQTWPWQVIRATFSQDGRFMPQPNDPTVTREDVLNALEEWTARGSLQGGDFDWVSERLFLKAATSDDIPRLIDARAAMLKRVSEDGIREAEVLGQVLARLGRSRYRPFAWLEPETGSGAETSTADPSGATAPGSTAGAAETLDGQAGEADAPLVPPDQP